LPGPLLKGGRASAGAAALRNRLSVLRKEGAELEARAVSKSKTPVDQLERQARNRSQYRLRPSLIYVESGAPGADPFSIRIPSPYGSLPHTDPFSIRIPSLYGSLLYTDPFSIRIPSPYGSLLYTDPSLYGSIPYMEPFPIWILPCTDVKGSSFGMGGRGAFLI
jgi:hypothetical protein